MGFASSAPCLVRVALAGAPARVATLAGAASVKFLPAVTAVDKAGTFVKHADFNLAFDKEEKTWRRTQSTRITITTTTT